MKEHSLSSGDIQMWPFLTTQPRISRVFAPSPPNAPQTPLFTLSNLEKPRANSSRSSNKWRLKQTKDNGRLSFVRVGTHGIQPPSSRHPPPLLPAVFITGKRTEKYHRIFVSVSQTLLLNGSRDAFEGTSSSEPWRYTSMRKNKFLGCTKGENGEILIPAASSYSISFAIPVEALE